MLAANHKDTLTPSEQVFPKIHHQSRFRLHNHVTDCNSISRGEIRTSKSPIWSTSKINTSDDYKKENMWKLRTLHGQDVQYSVRRGASTH